MFPDNRAEYPSLSWLWNYRYVLLEPVIEVGGVPAWQVDHYSCQEFGQIPEENYRHGRGGGGTSTYHDNGWTRSWQANTGRADGEQERSISGIEQGRPP